MVTVAQPAQRSRADEGSARVSLRGAALRFGGRILWEGLDLDVEAGEFVAVLGPNGSGKTTLLRVLLGLQRLHAGEVLVAGRPPRRGSGTIGYVPQQRALAEDLTLRASDLVGLGLDGHRLGIGLRGRGRRRERVAAALESVGAGHYAHAPVGRLSGGEQQRLRVAQALVGDPSVLLCDEPLLSLDLAHQLFVTHEINPVLPLVDRVLYLVEGRFRIGTPDEVMTSESLSELYRTDVDVLRVRGRLVVVGADSSSGADQHCGHLPARPESIR